MTNSRWRGFSLCGALLLGCARPSRDPPAGLVDSAGVTIASGPLTDRAAPWRVTSLQRLAPDDADSPLHLVRVPTFVAVDSAGRIFVHNEATEQIEVYNQGGQFLATRGRKGGGPGEYQYVGSLDVRPDGTLLVVDDGKTAIVSFGPDGAVLPQRSFAALGYAYGGIAYLGDTAVFYGRERDADGRPVHAIRWVAADRDTTLATLRPATLGQAKFQCPTSTLTLNGSELLFTPNSSGPSGQARWPWPLETSIRSRSSSAAGFTSWLGDRSRPFRPPSNTPAGDTRTAWHCCKVVPVGKAPMSSSRS